MLVVDARQHISGDARHYVIDVDLSGKLVYLLSTDSDRHAFCARMAEDPLKRQLYDEGYCREAIEERAAAASRAARSAPSRHR